MSKQEWMIGSVRIADRVAAAPLAGISNPAFRRILKKYGPGLIYTEMTSDKALIYKNRKTLKMLRVEEEERPVSLQIFGSDPQEMGQAAQIVTEQSKADIIDINMGCPMTKVVRQGAGCALMKDPRKVYDIVRSVRDHTDKPVTVKIRAGWDAGHRNAVEVAKMAEKAGASAIAVHGRTRAMFYDGQADWEIIRRVKQEVSVPVIGNGDITTPEQAKQRMEESGVDAVMIGRGMLGNPWLISRTVSVSFLESGTMPDSPDVHERFLAEKEQARALVEDYGEKTGMKMMRSHACWYVSGLSHASQMKAKVSRVSSYRELESLLDRYEQSLADGDYGWLRESNQV